MSEWIYEVIDFPKYQQKYCKDFCPEIPNSIFCVSDSSLSHYLVFNGSLFLSSTFLIYVQIGKHKYMACKSFQGSIPYNIFVGILENGHFINSFWL